MYGVGLKGVTVDKDPIELEDGELAQAQNATTDSIGSKGALRKRDGIGLFTTAGGMAGAVKGIIGLALPDTSKLIRRFYIGLDDFENPTTGNWRTSADGLTWQTLTSGNPQQPATWNNSFKDPTTAGAIKQQFPIACPIVSLNNILYYAGNDYSSSQSVANANTAPTLHSWDGTNDNLLIRLPKSPFTIATSTDETWQILSIVPYDSQTILLSTYDLNQRTRVFTFNTLTGALNQLGPQTDLNAANQALALIPAVLYGRVYFSSANLSGGVASKVWWARPGDTTWTNDSNGTTATSTGYCVGATAFKGNIYFGYLADTGGNGLIRKRDTTTGLYATAGAFITSSNAQGSGYSCLITDPTNSKMYAFERQFTANTYKIVSTTDGSTRVVEFDVVANVGATYTAGGNPTFDANGDLYWPVYETDNATHYFTQILKRTAAGVWSVVDNSAFHGRGSISKISF